jgi:hypothetical protein
MSGLLRQAPVHAGPQAQRVADLAAHAGIVAYGRSADAESVPRAARNVSYLNGVSPEGTVVSFNAIGAAGPVVRVTITTQRPLVLSHMVAARHSLDVTVHSAATIEQGQPACAQALDPMGSGRYTERRHCPDYPRIHPRPFRRP